MGPGGEGYQPCAREFGFVIRGNNQFGAEDYLDAIADKIGVENIKTFLKIRGNFGFWVKNSESVAKLALLILLL